VLWHYLDAVDVRHRRGWAGSLKQPTGAVPAGTLRALAGACRMHSSLVLLIISRLIPRAAVLLAEEYVSADLCRAVTCAERGRFHTKLI
jgi:hypothetical protein